jgi:hypothetical protein
VLAVTPVAVKLLQDFAECRLLGHADWQAISDVDEGEVEPATFNRTVVV